MAIGNDSMANNGFAGRIMLDVPRSVAHAMMYGLIPKNKRELLSI